MHPTDVSLSFFYQNVRVLNTKINTFYPNVCACDNDIIVLNETWLEDDVLSSEYFPSTYNVYRSPNGRRGSGILTAVHVRHLLG